MPKNKIILPRNTHRTIGNGEKSKEFVREPRKLNDSLNLN